MISDTSLTGLELIKKENFVDHGPIYEEVSGFEPLSLGLQTRTTSYSCEKDDEDYNEASLMSKSLPWIVRVYFQSADSMKGVLCSGEIIKKFTGQGCKNFIFSNNN